MPLWRAACEVGNAFLSGSAYSEVTKKMPGGLNLAFGQFTEFQAALSHAGVIVLLVTARGDFRARLVCASLDHSRICAGNEELSHIAFIAVPTDSVLVSLTVGHGPSPVWGGVEAGPGEILTIASGERTHMRTAGACCWATILVSTRHLTRYGVALAGNSFSVPPGITRWRPTPEAVKHLSDLHRAAVQMAATRSRMLTNAVAAHGLEQQLLHGLVDCLAAAPVGRETPVAFQQRGILAHLEELLQTEAIGHILDLKAAFGESRYSQCKYTKEQLGIDLKDYVRLRRLQQVYEALSRASPKATTIAEIAARHGFRSPGRFARDYRGRYGELPSRTLRRSSDCLLPPRGEAR